MLRIMDIENRSFWSIVRYVPDVERQEFRNIGAIVVRSEPMFAKAKLLLPEEFPLQRYRFLRSTMSQFGFAFPVEPASEFTAMSPRMELSRLIQLCDEATNIFQFKEPLPAQVRHPDKLLEDLYVIYVAPLPLSPEPFTH